MRERRKRRGGNRNTHSDSIERFYVSVGKRLSGIRRGNGGESPPRRGGGVIGCDSFLLRDFSNVFSFDRIMFEVIAKK